MRYAIISDIHSNLEALEAVLNALSKEKIDKYICLGDIVGYGGDPNPCGEKIKELKMHTILGNHDACCTGSFDLSNFTDYARMSLVWTIRNLEEKELDYLKTLELSADIDDFTIVHAALDKKEEFQYMVDAEEAEKSFKAMYTNILFVAHTHVSGVFEYKGNRLQYFKKDKIKVSKDTKYIVNTGSVGQSRDGDSRACYVVYDSARNEILIKRVAYDIEKAQAKILKARLPGFLAFRLREGI